MQAPHAHRIICDIKGQNPGPLLIVFGQTHGNEPAGTLALKLLEAAIREEPIRNPNFEFAGQIVGLYGNYRAMKASKRFINRDLNRSWDKVHIDNIRQRKFEDLSSEDKELIESLECINYFIEKYNPPRIVILDLHTTTADKGIFAIPSLDWDSRRIARNLHVPVIHGFLTGLKGTTLHFFNKTNFPKIPVTSVCFEAGQHQAESAKFIALSAIINCHRSIGGFRDHDIEGKHDRLLRENAHNHLQEALLVDMHPIAPNDAFSMRTDRIYKNFEPVTKGERLATHNTKAIHSKYNALILMPLYQKQGEDGFFLIQPLKNKEQLKALGYK